MSVNYHQMRLDREAADRAKRKDEAEILIDWGDSSLSFDFHCKCGARPCGGGRHNSYVKCPKCTRIYELPLGVVVREVSRSEQEATRIPPNLMDGE